MSKNGSSTGTAPKKASRRPRWLGPLLEDHWEQAPGSLTDQQTAFDYVVLVMDQNFGSFEIIIIQTSLLHQGMRSPLRNFRTRRPLAQGAELGAFWRGLHGH